jgi:diguanylate cyclase (GGDEF)-like protein
VFLGDKAYRYGGEEFCAVFKGMDAEDAYIFANRARRKLEERDFFIRKKNNGRSKKDRGTPKGKKVKVTISIGVSGPDAKASSPEQVIKKADTALYKAKEKGRNCVVAA